MKRVIDFNSLSKQEYKKPFIKVALVAYETSLLQSISDPEPPEPEVPWWDGEGD